MANDKEDINWLDNYKILKGINRENPFSVPQEYYFTESGSQIKSQIKLIQTETREDLLAIPDGYFDELSYNIQSRIRLEVLLPEKDIDFTIPENYFGTLNNKIVQKIQIEGKAAIGLRRFIPSKVYQYAAAACVFLALGASILLNRDGSNHLQDNIQTQLASIADTDIENYLKLNTDISDSYLIMENTDQDDIFKVKTSDLSNEELNDYLTTVN